MPHTQPKLNLNKLSATWGIMSLNSSHKSWNPLNKRFPRLFYLLCYYFATNRNYSISHRFGGKFNE